MATLLDPALGVISDPKKAGKLFDPGMEETLIVLNTLFPQHYVFIHDFSISDAQIDLILLCEKGIFVIEHKKIVGDAVEVDYFAKKIYVDGQEFAYASGEKNVFEQCRRNFYAFKNFLSSLLGHTVTVTQGIVLLNGNFSYFAEKETSYKREEYVVVPLSNFKEYLASLPPAPEQTVNDVNSFLSYLEERIGLSLPRVPLVRETAAPEQEEKPSFLQFLSGFYLSELEQEFREEMEEFHWLYFRKRFNDAITLLKNLREKTENPYLRALIAYNLAYFYKFLIDEKGRKYLLFDFFDSLLEYIFYSKDERALYYFAYYFLPYTPKDKRWKEKFYTGFKLVKEFFSQNQFLNHLFEAYHFLIKNKPKEAEAFMKQVYILSSRSPSNKQLFDRVYRDYEITYKIAESSSKHAARKSSASDSFKVFLLIIGLFLLAFFLQIIFSQQGSKMSSELKKEPAEVYSHQTADIANSGTASFLPEKKVLKQKKRAEIELKKKSERKIEKKLPAAPRKEGRDILKIFEKPSLKIEWPLLKREFSFLNFRGEFRNNGDFPVKSARLTIFFLDASGTARQDVTRTFYFDPPLYPGCSRKFSLSVDPSKLPSSWHGRYRMEVKVLNYKTYFTPLKFPSQYDRYFKLHNVRRRISYSFQVLEVSGEVENLSWPRDVNTLTFRIYFLGDRDEIVDFNEVRLYLIQKLIKNYIANFSFIINISRVSRRWTGRIKLSIAGVK